MASRLLLSREFLESQFPPHLSLFSGRPTGGSRVALVLKSASIDHTTKPAAGTHLKRVRVPSSTPISMPALAGESQRVSILGKLWIVPMVVLPIVGVVLGMQLDSEQKGNLPGYVGGGAAAVGIVLALVLKLWSAGRAVEMKLVDDYGTVEVRLPDHLRPVFDAYKTAQQQFEASRKAPAAQPLI